LVSGDEERLEGVLTELWEEYGIHAENPLVRETSGIKRLAIIHDEGVNAFGFKQPDAERFRPFKSAAACGSKKSTLDSDILRQHKQGQPTA